VHSGTVSKIDISGHKPCLKKYKRIEIISYVLSGHNGLKLEINNKGTAENIQTHGKQKHSVGQWVIKEIREEIQIPRIK
jgi:hypothetical protein